MWWKKELLKKVFTEIAVEIIDEFLQEYDDPEWSEKELITAFDDYLDK